MKGIFRIPEGVWGWHGTLLVAVVMATPGLVTLWLAPGARAVTDMAAIVSLVSYPVMLAAALALYFAWRVTFDHGTAWVATAFVALAIKGFALAGLRVAHASELAAHATTLLVFDLLFTATLVGMLWWGRSVAPPADPLLVGFGLGIVTSAARMAVVESGLGYPGAVVSLLIFSGVALVVLHLAFAYAAWTLLAAPPWASGRIAGAALLLGANSVVTHHVGDPVAASVTAIVTDVLAVLLLCVAATALLRMAIRESTSTVTDLSRRVADVEERHRVDRERLHEMNAAIAGIVTASELIHDGTKLSEHRRKQLERMVESEIARLRGMADPQVSPIGPVDLDETLEPVVVAQRVLGRHIDWTPTGHAVRGRAHDIAEVVTTLLENAAQHAPGSPVQVAARRAGEVIEVTVSDIGPGIPGEMSARLFEWGERGPSSHGQGIGLNVAKRLVEDLGGSLSSLSTNGCGATFALQLPDERAARGAASARA